jgi:hypothetical protein
MKSFEIYTVIRAIKDGFGLMIRFAEHLENITTNNDCSHCSTHFTNRCNHSTHSVFSVCYLFTSRYLVTDPYNVLCFHAHVLTC